MGTNAPFGAYPRYANDASGNVTGLVGPGSNVIKIGAPGMGVVVLGDSITNNCGGPGTSETRRHANYGYWQWLNAKRRGAMRMISNLGVSGQTMGTLKGRIDTEVIPLTPGLAIWLMSGNGIANGETAAEEISNVSSIVGKLRGAGIHVCIGTIPPRASTGTGSFDATMLGYVHEVNAYAWYLASTDSGIRVADTHAAWVDFSTGVPKTGVCRDTPAIHPSVLGAYLLAEAFDGALSGWVTGSHRVLPMSIGGNLISTALGSWTYNETGGTVTETRTSGATGSDGNADWEQLSVGTYSAAGAVAQLYHSNISAGYSVGDEIQISVEYEIDSATDIRAINFQCAFNGAGTNIDTCSEFATSSSGLDLPSNRPLKLGVAVSPVFPVPTGTTSITPKLRIVADSTSAEAIVRFRNPTIRNITISGGY